jgi:hypothetical protein
MILLKTLSIYIMGFETKFYDPSGRDFGDIFVDLCNNQTIYGSKTFITTPIIPGLVKPIFKGHTSDESNQAIPTGVKYCNIEICGGGGGGGGGIGGFIDTFSSNSIIFGGAGGAGGTYYNITLKILTNYRKYNITCGNGGSGGRGSTPGIDTFSGIDGSSSIITFCDVNNNVLYTITAQGGGGGGGGDTRVGDSNRYISSSFNAQTILPLVGKNLVYNNNGSVHKYSGILIDDISNNKSDSNYNQPSGGGGGGSILYITNLYGITTSDTYGFPGLNGGSVHLTNNESSICYIGSLGNNIVTYTQSSSTHTGSNGDNSNKNNKLSGGGGGSHGFVKNIYNKLNRSFVSNTNAIGNTIGGNGGNGYKGGGGGGGGSAVGGSSYAKTGGNGGSGGNGFVNLYFY